MRFATSNSAAEVLALIRRVHEDWWEGRFAYDPAAFAEKIAANGECIFAVDEISDRKTGGVFGYCNNSQDRIAYISFLGRIKSAPPGTGASLHRAFVELAKTRGMERVRLEVSKPNVRARQFYSRLGYIQIEDRGKKLLLERPL